jgi:hypothetical protein
MACDLISGTARSSAIEPSPVGGAQIAQAICDVVRDHDFGRRRTILSP